MRSRTAVMASLAHLILLSGCHAGSLGVASAVAGMDTHSEADAKINIDQLLQNGGWAPADKQQAPTGLKDAVAHMHPEVSHHSASA